MTRLAPRAAMALVSALVIAGPGSAAEGQSVPVTGRMVDVTLEVGGGRRGELIEAGEESLLLLSDGVLETVALGEVTRLRVRRHDFDATKAFLWVGLGAAISGAGLTYACNQVEDTDCGAVFGVTVLAWGLIGAPFAFGLASSRWGELQPRTDMLRPYARFPQGAPVDFRERRESGRSPDS